MTDPWPIRWLSRTGACLLLITLVCACQAPASPKTPPAPAAEMPAASAKGVLRVGITPNMPPLIFRQQGQIVGLEAEFARGLAQHLTYRLELVEVRWDDQINYLMKGRTDIIMSGMSITDMRRIRIAFCAPYAKTGQMALIRREDIQRFRTGYYSLVEIPAIGAIRDTTGDLFIRSRFPDTRKLFFDSLDDGVRALLRRKVDVLVHDAPAVMMAAARFENKLAPIPKMFTNEYLAWGVRKDNPELLEQANAYIATLKENGRLKEMVNRWIPFVEN
jgi:polar amino acid transport system substrate-binding protein